MTALLELDLTLPPAEARPSDPLAALAARGRLSVPEISSRLEEAASDPRVAGIVIKLGAPKMPLAIAQELHDVIRAFRTGGRLAFGWAETFGEFAPGTMPYLLACACDEIWLMPSGGVGLTGVATESPLLRRVLDKLDLEPLIAQRYEYKNAADTILRETMTDAHHEAASRLVESSFEQVVATIADDRGLSVEEVKEAVDRAPLFAQEAQEARLIDRIGYRDEVYAEARRRCGGTPELRYLSRYRRHGKAQQLRHKVLSRNKPVVALIHGAGTIAQGKSGRGAPPTGRKMGSDTISAAFRAAVRDPNVKSILFRVSSPGGSYVASDAIWREVCIARQEGKPVVVSMGALAASGGYFVSMGADAIVAQPGTLTGSIGVLNGKVRSERALERVGIHMEPIAAGRHALMFSSRTGFADEEWDRLNAWLDFVYADFTEKVARGRGLSIDEVKEVARGRVWTGADARDRGLVDELGGLRRAAALARSKAGLPDDAPLQPFPAVSPLSQLRAAQNSESPRVSGLAQGWGEWAALARIAGFPTGGPLVMPAVELRM